MNKVRVYGKAQNRTALGIMHAYMVMYPNATMEDLKKAFPDSLNPDSGVKKNFIYAAELNEDSAWNGFFKENESFLTMGDGRKVAVVSMWTKPSFARVIERAAEFGIEVAEFTEADKGIGQKGWFRLEYLNGYVPPKPKEKKKSLLWLWILLAVVAIGLVLFFVLRGGDKEKSIPAAETQTETIVEDEIKAEVKKIEAKFNAVQFELNSSELSSEATTALDELVAFMNTYSDVKIKVLGYASIEGEQAHNQELSGERAKATADVVDPNNLAANRRTEFVVL